MKNWPTDPIGQHRRVIDAFCVDLLAGCRDLNGPNVSRAVEINRQVNNQDSLNDPKGGE